MRKFVVGLSALLTVSLSSGCARPECNSDADCESGARCLDSGGVLFVGKTCVAGTAGESVPTDVGTDGAQTVDAADEADVPDDDGWVDPGCSDGESNSAETDVDCGGPDCIPCSPGGRCAEHTDCTSDICSAQGECVERDCDNRRVDGEESDVDCGGTCDGCAVGRACAGHTDCATGLCVDQTCVELAPSCRALAAAGKPSGDYPIDFDTDGVADATFECDQDVDGGGWTVIERCTARDVLRGTLVVVDDGSDMAVDDRCRPHSRDGSQNHTMYYEFIFPPGFTEFRFRDYSLRANAAGGDRSRIDPSLFIQSTWDSASGFSAGDVSFGSGDEVGPVTSYASAYEITGGQLHCGDCIEDWPLPDTTFEVAETAAFRIGFGESGNAFEGWYPWWDGAILLR